MAKKINKKLIGSLALVGVLVTSAVGVLMIKSLQQTDPTHYVEQAELRAKEQDWAQAKDYYRRAYYISKDPKYLMLAGQMLYENGDELAAERFWNQAVTIDPTLVEAHQKIVNLRTEIARLYPSPGAWRRVKKAATALLDVDAQNPTGKFAAGLATVQLSHDETDADTAASMLAEGMKDLERAVELAPEVVDYSLTLASLVRFTGTPEREGEILKELVETNTTPGENAARVRYTYARYLTRLNRFDEAVKFYEQAEAVAGDDPAVQAAAKSQHAQFWVTRWFQATTKSTPKDELDRYQQKARRLLEESIAIDDSSFLSYMLLAELHSYRGEHLAAIDVCQQRIDKPIRRTGIKAQQRKFSLYLLLLRAAEEALSYADTLDRNTPAYEEAVARAESFSHDAASEFTDRGPGLHIAGKIKLAQGDELAAIEQFQRAATAYGSPNWRNDRILAILLMRNNQPGAARNAISRALKDPTADSSCWITYAQILLNSAEYADAVRAADEALRRVPNNEDALRIKVAALAKSGEIEHAERIQERMPTTAPDLLLKAQILYDNEQFDDALRVYQSLLEREPTNTTYLHWAVRILTKLDRYDDAATIVRRALQDAPDDINIKLIELETRRDLSSEDRQQARVDVLNGIKDPFARHIELARLYYTQRKFDQYITNLDKAEALLAAGSTTIDRAARLAYQREIIERQFSFAAGNKDWPRVDQYVEKAVKLNVDGANGLTYRGRVHMLRQQPALALNSFKAALEKQPTNASTLTWVGECHMSLNPPQILEAQAYFERAIDADPDKAAAHRGLAVIAQMRGDDEQFERQLKECERLIPDDSWVQEQLLAIRDQATPAQGIARRLRLREQNPDDVTNLVKLAQLYVRTKQINKADECFESVVTQPKIDTAALRIAMNFFRGTGKVDRALQAATKRVETATDNAQKAQFELLIANHWHKLRHYDKAEQALRQAAAYDESVHVCAAFAAFKVSRNQFPEAIEWYDKAIALTQSNAPELAARFQREKIDVHLRAGDYRQARSEIDTYLDQHPNDPTGPLLRSAAATVEGDIDIAIDQLTRFLDAHPDNKHARLQRAKLYTSQGRREPAVHDLELLRGLDPKYRSYEPRMLLADAYVLINRFDLATAELESIIDLDPTAQRVAAHLITLYSGKDRYDDALRVCTSMVNLYPNEPLWLKTRAAVTDKLGDRAGAMGDYQAAAKLSHQDPKYTTPLLTSYAALKLFDRGIEYYQQSIPVDKRTPRVKLRYAVILALNGDVDAAKSIFLDAFDAGGFRDLPLVRDLGTAIITSCGGEKSIDLFRREPANPALKRANKHLLGILLSRLKRHSEALANAEALLETAQSDDEKTLLYAAMGNMHEEQESWDLARQDYEQLLKLDDRNIIGLNNLAYLLSDKLHRPADAVAYAKQASVITGSPTVHDTLAWTYVQLGEYRKAIAILTKALQDNPRFIVGIFHLAEAYRRSGDLTKASEILKGAENLLSEDDSSDDAQKVRQCRQDILDGRADP